jgi:hypothetical protein
VDASHVQEGAPAVDAGQPAEVGVVGGLVVVTRRPVGGPGGVVDQVPAVVVVGEAEVRVTGEHLGDDRGQAGATDNHQVVAVQVDQAGRWDDLVAGVEAEGAGQLAEALVGLEAFLGDNGAGLGLVGLQPGAEGDGEWAVAQEQALAAGSGGQELADPGAGHAQMVGELSLGHAQGDELLDGLPADAGELGAGWTAR